MLSRNVKRGKSNKGFTLIELIVVIAILGILALIAVPRLGGFSKSAQTAADKETANVVRKSMEMAIASGQLQPPVGGPAEITMGSSGELNPTSYPGLNYSVSQIESVIDTLVDKASRKVKDTYTFTIQTNGNVTVDNPVSPSPVVLTLTMNSVNPIGETTATLNFTSNFAGTYYYLLSNSSITPTANEVKTNGTSGALATAGTNTAVNLTALLVSTDYYAYVVVVNPANETSSVESSGLFTTSAHVLTDDEILTAAMNAMATAGLSVANSTGNYPRISAPGDTAEGVVFVFQSATALDVDGKGIYLSGSALDGHTPSNKLAIIARRNSGTPLTHTLTVRVSYNGLTRDRSFSVYIPNYPDNGAIIITPQ